MVSYYDKRTEEIAKEYSPRVLALLNRIAEAVRALGGTVEGPDEEFGDQWRWGMGVRLPGHEQEEPEESNASYITLTLEESLHHEGTKRGINWHLFIGAWGGLILGVFSPYNYTPQVWVSVRDDPGIAERWSFFEELDVAEVARIALRLDR